ncbi:hypothetical protein BASA61_007940 [Batrachochytrium salamandrivorans]|nr:hypothetical protein BASA61_007940 [Batrachochytrium salamandrivorans]
MVNVSFILVLALVSPAVVAQPRTNGFTGLAACFKRQTTSELSTNTIYERIPLSGGTLKSTSDEDSAKIGLSYILQKLKPEPNKFKVLSFSSQDFKRDFTYTAIELPNENPRDGFSEIVNPENIQSSPKGWSDGFELEGNNALVSSEGGEIFKTTTEGIFNMVFDPISPPQTPTNIVVGVINAFYAFTCRSSLVTNMVHDVFYAYGFNERAGNFQWDNFNRGGIGEDPVIINIQDSRRADDASFYTPPDGQPGVLNLHIYTATEPNRDPALDNTMLTHELTHGLSRRLTGGARGSICMISIESRGLSEGYSDAIALIFMAKPEDTRDTEKVMGEYVKERPGGLRRNTDDSALQIPTFDSAHDAMLAADEMYYDGVNEHLIRQGFAKRGLGSISQLDPIMDSSICDLPGPLNMRIE